MATLNTTTDAPIVEEGAVPAAGVAIEALRALVDQLVIVLAKRLAPVGVPLVLPVAEVDGTGDYWLELGLRPHTREFELIVHRKH